MQTVILCKTWIYFPVVPDPIGINDVLEARRELVGLVEGWWGLLGLHPVQDGRHRRAAPLLSNKAFVFRISITIIRPVESVTFVLKCSYCDSENKNRKNIFSL